jgi:hypothetical protein
VIRSAQSPQLGRRCSEPMPSGRFSSLRGCVEGVPDFYLQDSWKVLLSWADRAETAPAASRSEYGWSVPGIVIGSPKLRGVECIEGIQAKNEIPSLPNRRALLQ